MCKLIIFKKQFLVIAYIERGHVQDAFKENLLDLKEKYFISSIQTRLWQAIRPRLELPTREIYSTHLCAQHMHTSPDADFAAHHYKSKKTESVLGQEGLF